MRVLFYLAFEYFEFNLWLLQSLCVHKGSIGKNDHTWTVKVIYSVLWNTAGEDGRGRQEQSFVDRAVVRNLLERFQGRFFLAFHFFFVIITAMKPEEFPTSGNADVLTEVPVLTPRYSLRIRAGENNVNCDQGRDRTQCPWDVGRTLYHHTREPPTWALWKRCFRVGAPIFGKKDISTKTMLVKAWKPGGASTLIVQCWYELRSDRNPNIITVKFRGSQLSKRIFPCSEPLPSSKLKTSLEMTAGRRTGTRRSKQEEVIRIRLYTSHFRCMRWTRGGGKEFVFFRWILRTSCILYPF